MKAVMFVHPGFLRREDLLNTLVLDELRGNKEYGDYNSYLACLRRLSHISLRKVFVVDCLERKLHPYHEGFVPGKDDMVLEWPSVYARGFSGNNVLFPLTAKQNGWIRSGRILQEKVASYLSMQGIDEVLLCGELGPYRSSGRWSHLGCVGMIYGQLVRRALVKCVQGGIFPVIPDKFWVSEYYQHRFREELFADEADGIFAAQEQLYKDLYDNAVPLEEAIRSE